MENLRLGVITDMHLVVAGTPPEPRMQEPEGWDLASSGPRLRAAVARLATEQLDGVVVLGDIANHGDDHTLDYALADLEALPGWLCAAPGNHDVVPDPDALARALARAGRSAAVVDGLHLGVLDLEGVDWIMRCRTRAPLPVQEWGDEPALVASHIPLLFPAVDPVTLEEDLVDRAQVVQALEGRQAPTVVLSGHEHVRAACTSGHMLQLVFPALITDTPECAILELDGSDAGLHLTRTVIALDGSAPDGNDRWRYDGDRWIEA